jgi:hypothetical protein
MNLTSFEALGVTLTGMIQSRLNLREVLTMMCGTCSRSNGALSESDARQVTGELVRREETAGAIQIIDGKPRKPARRRVD